MNRLYFSTPNVAKENSGIFKAVGAALTLCTTGFVGYVTLRPAAVQVSDDVSTVADLVGILPTAIDASTISENCDVLSAEEFVHRPALESTILWAETDIPNGRYTIVYGPKGVGKSALVNYVAGARKGVVLVEVTSSHDKASLTRELGKALLGPRADNSVIDSKTVAAAIRKSKAKPVTIIFDVERGSHDGNTAVRSVAKSLAHCSRCVIVLSEADAVVEFGRDPRETFVFVGELSSTEAIEFLKKKGCRLNESEMENVFDKVGTSPTVLQELLDMIRVGSTIQAFIAEKIAVARCDLVAFPLKPILSELKKQPDGAPLALFESLKFDGVALFSPDQVGKVMKNSRNPIVFDMQRGCYILMSRAHRTALVDYEPIVACKK